MFTFKSKTATCGVFYSFIRVQILWRSVVRDDSPPTRRPEKDKLPSPHLYFVPLVSAKKVASLIFFSLQKSNRYVYILIPIYILLYWKWSFTILISYRVYCPVHRFIFLVEVGEAEADGRKRGRIIAAASTSASPRLIYSVHFTVYCTVSVVMPGGGGVTITTTSSPMHRDFTGLKNKNKKKEAVVGIKTEGKK